MSKNNLSIKTYVTGFAVSVLLTLTSFGLVVFAKIPYWLIVLVVLTLAVVQLFVQLYYFLHLREESRPRLKLNTFLAAAVVVIVIVFGSLWIMENLSRYHGHNILPEDVDEYVQDEEAIYR